MLMVCFEDQLATEWYRIYQAMETVVDGHIGTTMLVKVFKSIRYTDLYLVKMIILDSNLYSDLSKARANGN